MNLLGKFLLIALFANELLYAQDTSELVNRLLSDNLKARVEAQKEIERLDSSSQKQLCDSMIQVLIDGRQNNAQIFVPEALKKIPTVSIPLLANAMDNNNAGCRTRIANVLGNIGRPARAALPRLLRGLKDIDVQVRHSAAYSIAKIGYKTDEVISSLQSAIKENTGDVQMMAIDALAELDPWTAKEAMPILKDGVKKNDDKAFFALQKMGPAAQDAIPELINALVGQDENIQLDAVTALAEMGPAAKTALPTLIEIIKGHGNQSVRMVAVGAIIQIGPEAKTALPALKEMEKDKDDMVRRQAMQAERKIESYKTATFGSGN